MKSNKDILKEQAAAYELHLQGDTQEEIASKLNISRWAAQRRLNGAKKAARLDPELAQKLQSRGITDLAGLHSGWLIEKDENGAGQSLYFYLGPDQEKISFADAMRDVLSDIEHLPPIKRVPVSNQKRYLGQPGSNGKDYATWLAVADLHVGGDYGDEYLELEFNRAIDDLIARLPPAEKAVLFELGDLLDANDHKGVTPASGNPCDVKRNDVLKNTLLAIKLLRRAIYRLAETHDEVEVHLIKGNHDPTAYMAVMLGLSAHFENNPRVNIVVTDDEFRVISWGECAAFPNHGDKAKWDQLKDVFADQFPDEWAAAKVHRHIMTAHYHHDRKRDLVGATAEQYRTLHRPNKWAKGLGLYSRGSLTAMTVHKERGEEYRTISNIKPILKDT